MKLKAHLVLILSFLTSDCGCLASCPQGLSASSSTDGCAGNSNTGLQFGETRIQNCRHFNNWTSRCSTTRVTCILDEEEDCTTCQCTLTMEDIQTLSVSGGSHLTQSTSTTRPDVDQGTGVSSENESRTTEPQTHRSSAPITTTYTSMTGSAKDPHCQCEVAVGALGTLVGILLVLLAIVSTSWAWTCWSIKKSIRVSNTFAVNPLCNSTTTDQSNNTTQETTVYPRPPNQQYTCTALTLATSSQIAARNTNHMYTQQATLSAGQDGMQDTKDEDTDNCEHDYHILEQPANMNNDYEELDKYEKKGRSQKEDNDVGYTVEGPVMEGEGPEGGASNILIGELGSYPKKEIEGGICTGTNESASEEHDKSALISKYGN